MSNYTARLSRQETEEGIRLIKTFFQDNISTGLQLRRITSPMFVEAGRGINDDLNGVEQPVSFVVGGKKFEIIHSLAKWKRMKLAELGFGEGYGIYTDMNAIRKDESLDNIHSLYVDQWDWEQVIAPQCRTRAFLEKTVKNIFYALKRTEYLICERFSSLERQLPDAVTFVDAEELLRRYPGLSAKEREDAVCRAHKCVFIERIGAPLSDGRPHDLRAPDYDDWQLNGDLLVWDTTIGRALELSSMGIRVDAEVLTRQLAAAGKQERAGLYWHRQLLEGRFPQTIGGGIGQSRLCMFLLNKYHIGEVQSSVWTDDVLRDCEQRNIVLL